MAFSAKKSILYVIQTTQRETLQTGVPYILFYTVLFHPVCVLIDKLVLTSLLSPSHNLQATVTVCVAVVSQRSVP